MAGLPPLAAVSPTRCLCHVLTESCGMWGGCTSVRRARQFDSWNEVEPTSHILSPPPITPISEISSTQTPTSVPQMSRWPPMTRSRRPPQAPATWQEALKLDGALRDSVLPLPEGPSHSPAYHSLPCPGSHPGPPNCLLQSLVSVRQESHRDRDPFLMLRGKRESALKGT